jgi:hypothetical protein
MASLVHNDDDCKPIASGAKKTYILKQFPVYKYVDGERVIFDASQSDLQKLYGCAVGYMKHVLNVTNSTAAAAAAAGSANGYTILKFHDAFSWLPNHVAWQNIIVRLNSGDADGPFALLGDIWNSSSELFSFAQHHAATLGKVLLDFTNNNVPPHSKSCWIQLHNVLPPRASDCDPEVRCAIFNTGDVPAHSGHMMYKPNLNTLSKTIGKSVDEIIGNAESTRVYMHQKLKVPLPVTTTPSTPPTKHAATVPAAPVKKKVTSDTTSSDKAAGSGASTSPDGMTPQQMQFALELAMRMAVGMAQHKGSV